MSVKPDPLIQEPFHHIVLASGSFARRLKIISSSLMGSPILFPSLSRQIIRSGSNRQKFPELSSFSPGFPAGQYQAVQGP
jgi:hypothetical protein